MGSWWVCACDGWEKMLAPDQACPIGSKRSKRKGCGLPTPMRCDCGNFAENSGSLFPKCRPCRAAA